MEIKNEMEALVRAEVAKAKQRGGAVGCWCALCETDVVALALSLLPPLYYRTTTYGYAAGIASTGKIHDAVQAAVKRVTLRPKHPRGASRAALGEISLVNYTWEVGNDMVGPALGRDSSCSCMECRSDALAYALNRYPPKYGVSRAGRRNLQTTYVDFMRHELLMLISQAARVVSEHPHH